VVVEALYGYAVNRRACQLGETSALYSVLLYSFMEGTSRTDEPKRSDPSQLEVGVWE